MLRNFFNQAGFHRKGAFASNNSTTLPNQQGAGFYGCNQDDIIVYCALYKSP